LLTHICSRLPTRFRGFIDAPRKTLLIPMTSRAIIEVDAINMQREVASLWKD
jgi:hypothetical protein